MTERKDSTQEVCMLGDNIWMSFLSGLDARTLLISSAGLLPVNVNERHKMGFFKVSKNSYMKNVKKIEGVPVLKLMCNI